mgnify:CR=1 FL=1|jgi:adhesin transport system outer membrane protein
MRRVDGFRAGIAFAASLGLAGCMELGGDVTRARTSDLNAPTIMGSGPKAEPAVLPAEAQSPVISTLQSRRSILPEGGAFDQVAAAVLAANSRAAEAELRAARLRAEAQSKNWLPTLGPQISLTSLGQVIAQLVIDQVLFDGGKRKAERDFAKADVEVSAVRLAEDTNRRVYEALALYVLAQEAREKAGLSAAALKDMGRFAYIMEQRVNGGISDTSDLNILRQKLAEIRSSEQMSRETAETSFAELNAMSVKKLDGVSGLSAVSVDPAGARPLAVVLAEAEKERSVAGAQAERAGHMPVICAQVIGGTGGVSAGVTAVTAKPLGFGTGASLKAIEAATEAATRRVAQADEDARRDIARLMQEAQGLDRQGMEAQALTAQAKANLDLFQEQYDAGQRQVMDVVGVYETYARAAQSAASLKYRAVLARLEIARDLGLLADGSEI